MLSHEICVSYSKCLPKVLKTVQNVSHLHTRLSGFKQKVREMSSVQIDVDKRECLLDEDMVVKVTGLSHKDKVTVIATTQQDQLLFWSHGLFSANKNGVVNLSTDRPINGSYDKADPAGLLWSMTSAPWLPKGTRLFQARAVKPMIYKFSVFPPSDTPSDFLTDNTAQLASVEHKRWYKGPHVRRVPIDHPRIRGTLFLPEGRGPFPGVIYMYGGLVPIVEGSAALLASHGFASLALCYCHYEGLPNTFNSVEMNYVEEATDWFAGLSEVRSDGLGVLGLSLGGIMALWMAQAIPNIKGVVNINGLPFVPCTWTHNGQRLRDTTGIDKTKLVYTDEGLMVKDVFVPDERYFFKPWNHGAHLLTLLSGDDLMMNMSHNIRYYNELMPKDYRQEKAEMEFFPGAGHLIEPPYSPHCRTVDAVQKFLLSIAIADGNTYPSYLMSGGFPEEHAVAQKKSWHRILDFFKTHLL